MLFACPFGERPRVQTAQASELSLPRDRHQHLAQLFEQHILHALLLVLHALLLVLHALQLVLHALLLVLHALQLSKFRQCRPHTPGNR